MAMSWSECRRLAVPACFAMVALGAAAQARPESRTLGFVVTRFSPAIYHGPFESDCPQGFEASVEENYLATQTPTERKRLLRSENSKELERRWKIDFTTGPNGEDICRNVRSFLEGPDHPSHRTVQGKVSYGVDLDGRSDEEATSTTCGHRNFTGPAGEPGIDNQLYRAVGCHKQWRGLAPDPGGDLQQKLDQYRKEGMYQYLVEIRGVDDPRNDPAVEVGIYSSDDVPLLDSAGVYLPNQSFGVTRNPRWRHETTGRIVDGMLTTDPIETMHLNWSFSTNGEAGAHNEYELRHAVFQLDLLPNGNLKGVIGAYQSPDGLVSYGRHGGKGVANVTNRDCASEYKTLLALADGYPDPQTGQCTMVSMANHVEGVPAYVVHGERGARLVGAR